MNPKPYENHHISHVIEANWDHLNRFEDKGGKYLRVSVNDNIHADLGPHFCKALSTLSASLVHQKQRVECNWSKLVGEIKYSHIMTFGGQTLTFIKLKDYLIHP